MEKAKFTPMMQHYITLKEAHPDCILFYRLGDFYEMFLEDAKTVSQELDLVLTGRAAGNNQKVPMCGIPFHAADSYIARLIKKGYKVAICEQLEDPSTAKGLVKRDIIKTITPGTYMEPGTYAKQDQYLAAVCADAWNLCILFCELTTGELLWMKTDKNPVALERALKEKQVKEAVLDKSISRTWKQSLANTGLALSQSPLKVLEAEEKALIPERDSLLEQCLQLLMQYLEDTQKQPIRHLRPAVPLHQAKTLKMDLETRSHLELTETASQAAKAQSLWQFMDRCKTAMGSRLLRRWLENPLTDIAEIEKRQEAVQTLLDQFLLRENLLDHLDRIYDMERLAARISYGNASPRDILQLVSSLEQLPEMKSLAARLETWPEWKNVPDLQELYADIKDAIRPDPPMTAREGNLFQSGYNARLDHLRSLADNGRQTILSMEARLKEQTGIKSLKIGYNRVFGYYIDITKANQAAVKPEYGFEICQTLANSTRYRTPELKQTEEEILTASEQKEELEQQLYQELLERIRAFLYDIHMAAQMCSTLDVLCAYAVLAQECGYIRPAFHESRELVLLEGRHPVLEQRLDTYVSNNWILEADQDVLLVTGPNMGGKSTWMRQNALLVVMAQAGSFIPARQAVLPVFDQIFTRMGASDDLQSGTSTFMAEMLEANHALQYATASSLILFDEIGRGTATYDGMAIAQAMLEYISGSIQARTLFSTHYHELTQLEESLSNLKNVHVDVKEKQKDITFAYRIVDGKADKSYGIHVARLARLPQAVLARAESLLQGLEASAGKVEYQPSLFVMDRQDPAKSRLMERLDQIQTDEMTPRQALECLYELKQLRKEVED